MHFSTVSNNSASSLTNKWKFFVSLLSFSKKKGRIRENAMIAGVKNNPIINDLLLIFLFISQRTTFIVLRMINTFFNIVFFSRNIYKNFMYRHTLHAHFFYL